MVKKGPKKEKGSVTSLVYQSGRTAQVELLYTGKMEDLFMHAAVTKQPLVFKVNENVPIEHLQPTERGTVT